MRDCHMIKRQILYVGGFSEPYWHTVMKDVREAVQLAAQRTGEDLEISDLGAAVVNGDERLIRSHIEEASIVIADLNDCGFLMRAQNDWDEKKPASLKHIEIAVELKKPVVLFVQDLGFIPRYVRHLPSFMYGHGSLPWLLAERLQSVLKQHQDRPAPQYSVDKFFWNIDPDRPRYLDEDYSADLASEPSANDGVGEMTSVKHGTPGRERHSRRRAGGTDHQRRSEPADKESAPREQHDKWDVFISHASEDAAYVEPLARALAAAGVSVWYDKKILQWGDDLRPAIDYGLTNCRYAIVVLSKAFLAKKKWTEHELNGLFAREQPGKKVVLPIWHGITYADLLRYSPTMADRLAKISEDDSHESIVNSLRGLLAR
jgi:TIR domain-containing protein